MRISDWSSDVCSSDLDGREIAGFGALLPRAGGRAAVAVAADIDRMRLPVHRLRGVGLALEPVLRARALRHEHHRIVGRGLAKGGPHIGKASVRERVCPYV